MNDIGENFKRVKESIDFDEINDFLIELINKPDINNLKYLDYFLENYQSDILDKIMINIIYLIGQIGCIENIDAKYQEFLLEEYFKSDRWIRNEILKSLDLISNKNYLSKELTQILEYSLLDDYNPIKISSLSLLLKFDSLSNSISKNLLKLSNFLDSNLIDIYTKVLRKFFINEDQIFQLLNKDETYKTLNKNSIRTLLITFFKSILDLESFRDLISNAKWEIKYKENFLKEIYTFEKILMKKIY
ncbi:MAG: hypothetical protein ACFFBP_08035 [Promethearchaeota archaeon]